MVRGVVEDTKVTMVWCWAFRRSVPLGGLSSVLEAVRMVMMMMMMMMRMISAPMGFKHHTHPCWDIIGTMMRTFLLFLFL